jgi:hypothetical protein
MPGPTGPSGVFSTAQLTYHHMNFSLSGGGTVTVKVVSNTVRIRWDTRMLALPLMGKAGVTNYNIDCPASGTTGTGQIIDANGIPMGANTNMFSAPYYQLPTASTSFSTLVGNFRVVSYLSTVDNIDPSWVLLAVLNTDASQALVKWQAGGVVLPLPDNGQQIQWDSNAQQLGRGANKIVLDGGTGNATISGDLFVNAGGSLPSRYGRVICEDQYHAMILRGDINYTAPNYTITGGQAVTTFVQFGGTWRFRHVNQGANLLLFEIAPSMVSSIAPVTVSAPSNYGQMRVAPAVAGLESAISFARNPDHTFTNRGDTWILGRNVFGVGDRNFAIARFGPSAGNALTITEDGIVNVVSGALNLNNVAVQRIPYVSCCISGNTTVGNSRGQITPTSQSPAEGARTVTLSPPHPAGASMNPQVSLIGAWGNIYVDSPTDGATVTIGTQNIAGTATNLDFYLLIL